MRAGRDKHWEWIKGLKSNPTHVDVPVYVPVQEICRVTLWTCQSCYGTVTDTAAHTKWHISIGDV